jgi:hypothetical protein
VSVAKKPDSILVLLDRADQDAEGRRVSILSSPNQDETNQHEAEGDRHLAEIEKPMARTELDNPSSPRV